MVYIGEESLIMVNKGVRAVVFTDWSMLGWVEPDQCIWC